MGVENLFVRKFFIFGKNPLVEIYKEGDLEGRVTASVSSAW